MRPVNSFFLLISVLCSLGVQAQKYSLGLKGGLLLTYPNFADQVDHQNTTSRVNPGFSLGGLIIFPLKNKYSFVTEAGYSHQGRSVKFVNIGTHYNISTYNFADLSMALRKTFRLKIKENVATNWFLNIGPNINYWLGGRGRIETDNGITQKYTIVFDKTPGIEYDKMYMNDVNRWLFGLNVGFGFNATTRKNQKLITEIRMTWGQTYMGKSNSASLNLPIFQTEQQSMKFNLKVLNVSVAYIFDRDMRTAKKGKSDIKKKLK